MALLTTVFVLMMGHAVADFALQSKDMAIYKNRHNENPTGVPWYYWMLAHSLTHGAVVGVITQSIGLALIETTLHFIIDVLKCEKITNIHMDQYLHVLCKIGYVIFLM